MDRINEAISGAISYAQSKREFIGKQLINILLLLIIFVITGCLDFVNLSFHFEYLSDTGYWSTVITKVISGVCAFNIGINVVWDVELRKNAILADAINQYNELMKRKQVDFEYYVVKIFNPQEKKKAYISHINRQIYLLNKISRKKDRLLYSSDLPENQEKKLKNRYCIKRKELEDLKSEDFINKNLESINVRYNYVDPAAFELEVDGSQKYHGLKTVGNVMVGKLKASFNIVLGMITVSMFITALKLEYDQEMFIDKTEAMLNLLFKCVEDIGVILWQFIRGMARARKIISAELTQVYISRNKVLNNYLEWRLVNKRPDTEVYKELNKQEEYIEISQEELDKLKGGS